MVERILNDILTELKDAQDDTLTFRPEDAIFHLVNAETILRELQAELGYDPWS